MSILSGYGKFKRYVLTSTGYRLCSQWTSSNTVHFDDGKTAQTKLGAISGITDSLTATSSNVALSAKAGKSLQDQVTELNTGLANLVCYTWDSSDATWQQDIINYYKQLPNDIIFNAYLRAGWVGRVNGLKADDSYGYMILYCYNDVSTPIRIRCICVTDGVWTPWKETIL